MTTRVATMWLLLIAAQATASEPPQPSLQLGQVTVTIGSPAKPVISELSQHFQTRAIEGGWEVRSKVEDARVPIAAIGVKGGKIVDVSLMWGPGVTPSLEEMVSQLVLALPGDNACHLHTHAGPFEGGTSRNVRWECVGYRVWLNSSVWSPTSGSASILVRLAQP